MSIDVGAFRVVVIPKGQTIQQAEIDFVIERMPDQTVEYYSTLRNDVDFDFVVLTKDYRQYICTIRLNEGQFNLSGLVGYVERSTSLGKSLEDIENLVGMLTFWVHMTCKCNKLYINANSISEKLYIACKQVGYTEDPESASWEKIYNLGLKESHKEWKSRLVWCREPRK